MTDPEEYAIIQSIWRSVPQTAEHGIPLTISLSLSLSLSPPGGVTRQGLVLTYLLSLVIGSQQNPLLLLLLSLARSLALSLFLSSGQPIKPLHLHLLLLPLSRLPLPCTRVFRPPSQPEKQSHL